ncbi:MAG: toprim domain-containing protein, partial [Campylobacterota bacterium]|nr:toprim domain-containing protein [Campylobacterota bacterium]
SLEYDNNFKKQDTSLIDKVNQYYQKLLVHNDTALKYLKSRGISDFSIEKFEIGYASSSNDTIEFLKKSFLNLADAKEFGIIDSGQNGLYARFIERITFPIYTITGNIVGFGGRTITGHNAKYVNSPQTKLFNKSRLLYGYNLAKETIYKQKSLIVTEGYLDVVMLHQAGFTNSVATLGTALTTEHLPLLKRGEPKIIVAYDGDKAGLNAAYKASLLLSHGDFKGGVVIFGDGMDPADMVNDNKIDLLNEMFLNPTPFIPYVLDFIIKSKDISNPQEKQEALKETNDYLKTLNPILQEEYASLIARKLNINEGLVQIQHKPNQRTQNVNLTQADIAELSIIRAALDNEEFYEIVVNNLQTNMLQTHINEFNILLNDKNDPSLMGISINEHLKEHTKESLENQIVALSKPYYERELQKIKLDNEINFKKKIKIIRELQDKLQKLKLNKLVDF